MSKTNNKKATIDEALVPVEEQLYKVPENWVWTYLLPGAAECKDGFRKPINASERAGREGDIPYYGATGQVGWIDDYLTDEQLVLVGEDGAPFLDVLKDKAYIIEGKAWVNNHAHILKSWYGETGNKFLLNYLNTFNYHGFVNGTTRLKLTQASMAKIPVPLPPLPEQQRIVEQIENLFSKLDEGKEKIQEVFNEFDSRKLSILHEAFTGKLTRSFRNNAELDGWINTKIGDLTDIVSSKRVYKEEYTDSGVPFFRSSEVVDLFDDGYTEPTYFISKKRYEEIKNQYGVPEKGDLLVTSVGTIGKTWIVDDREFYYKDGNLTQIKKCKELDMRYVQYYIMSNEFMYQVSDTVAGTAYNALTIVKFKNINIPVPPMLEQLEIIRILDEFFENEKHVKIEVLDVMGQIDLIKKAILAKAFRGELGTNDPSEESLMELLKQILQ